MSEELDYSLVPSDESTLNQIQPIDLTKSDTSINASILKDMSAICLATIGSSVLAAKAKVSRNLAWADLNPSSTVLVNFIVFAAEVVQNF